MQSDDYFIDEVAALLGIWGVAQTPGRLFAHLLLLQQPASLDAIAADLDISKTTASEAAKLMERHGFLRRHGTPGSKRASYGPSDNFTVFYDKQASYLERMGKVMKAQEENDPSLGSSKRLRAMAEYYDRLAQAMKAINEDYR
jgi:DNA-binding transcriptional regulator GbsR (MarR family)